MRCYALYIYIKYVSHILVYIHNDEFINLDLPDTYTVVTVQVVLGRRLSEKQWDVDQVFW